MSSIKPIRSDEDLDAALARMEEIFDAKPGSAEDNELGVLLGLVEFYEDKHYPIEFPDPISSIEIRMEQEGLTAEDLVPSIGPPAEVNAVLSRQRDITMPMARALYRRLGIPAEALLQEPSLDKDAAVE